MCIWKTKIKHDHLTDESLHIFISLITKENIRIMPLFLMAMERPVYLLNFAPFVFPIIEVCDAKSWDKITIFGGNITRIIPLGVHNRMRWSSC